MSKSYGFYTPRSVNVAKMYIVTQPTSSSDLLDSDMEDGGDAAWMDKSRRLQIRRWRKIKNQTA